VLFQNATYDLEDFSPLSLALCRWLERLCDSADRIQLAIGLILEL